MQQNNLVISLLFGGLLFVAAAVFWPALTGPFLLDDFLHLPKLAENTAVDSLQALYQFVLTGAAVAGRPLSFLSILINDNTWPTDPWGFKYTNLLIHLLNGVLVFIFIRRLSQMLEDRTSRNYSTRSNVTALLVMAIWLLHPMQLSTMMLVIQRMTLLMAMFTLLGLIFYLKGRLLAPENPRSGYIRMCLGVGLFGLLGILSKETAVMIVFYVLTLEVTLMAHLGVPKPIYWKYWFSIFILVPIAAIALYFLANMPYMDDLYLKRDFNMVERLLTETRVLASYLGYIVLPSLSGTGPYHDDFLISRGLLEPPTTLFAIVAIVAALAYATLNRRRHPLLAFAVFWFFLAHILESTILPLELYFEHRNYLPMLGIFFSVSYWAIHSRSKIRNAARAGLIAFLALEIGISHASSRVWGSDELIANVWAHEHPGSLRAQLDAVKYWLERGQMDRVDKHINTALSHNTDDAGLWLYRFTIDRCNDERLPRLGSSIDDLEEVVPSAGFDHASLDGIRFLIEHSRTGRCRITDAELLNIIELYLDNRKFRGVDKSRAYLHQSRARIYLSMGNLDGTINALDKAYEAVPDFSTALDQAYYLYTAGLYTEALRYIEKARDSDSPSPYAWVWKDRKISAVESMIRKAMKDQNGTE